MEHPDGADKAKMGDYDGTDNRDTANSTPVPPTWTAFFPNHTKNNNGNKNLNVFNAVYTNNKTKANITSFARDPDNIILFVTHHAKIGVLHSPTAFDLTHCNWELVTLGCLIGLDTEALPYKIDKSTEFAPVRIRTPLLASLCDYILANDLLGFTAPTPKAYLLKGSAIILPGPFIRSTIIGTDEHNPYELILKVYGDANKFDREEYSESTHSGSAFAHNHTFAIWAWGVKGKEAKETRFYPPDGATTAKLQGWACDHQLVLSGLRDGRYSSRSRQRTTGGD